MTNKKTEELNEAELDQVTGGLWSMDASTTDIKAPLKKKPGVPGSRDPLQMETKFEDE